MKYDSYSDVVVKLDFWQDKVFKLHVTRLLPSEPAK